MRVGRSFCGVKFRFFMRTAINVSFPTSIGNLSKMLLILYFKRFPAFAENDI